MYFQLDLCYFCLKHLTNEFNWLCKTNEEGSTYHEKIKKLFVFSHEIFPREVIGNKLCLECCNTIDEMCIFTKKCIENTKIYNQYKSKFCSSNVIQSELNLHLPNLTDSEIDKIKSDLIKTKPVEIKIEIKDEIDDSVNNYEYEMQEIEKYENFQYMDGQYITEEHQRSAEITPEENVEVKQEDDFRDDFVVYSGNVPNFNNSPVISLEEDDGIDAQTDCARTSTTISTKTTSNIRSTFGLHKNITKSPEKQKYVCKCCNTEFNRKSKLESHMKSHSILKSESELSEEDNGNQDEDYIDDNSTSPINSPKIKNITTNVTNKNDIAIKNYVLILHDNNQIQYMNQVQNITVNSNNISSSIIPNSQQYNFQENQNLPNMAGNLAILPNMATSSNILSNAPPNNTILSNVPPSSTILPNVPTSGTILPNIPTSRTIWSNIPTSSTMFPNIPTSSTILSNITGNNAIFSNTVGSGTILPNSVTNGPFLSTIPGSGAMLPNTVGSSPFLPTIPGGVAILPNNSSNNIVLPNIPGHSTILPNIVGSSIIPNVAVFPSENTTVLPNLAGNSIFPNNNRNAPNPTSTDLSINERQIALQQLKQVCKKDSSAGSSTILSKFKKILPKNTMSLDNDVDKPSTDSKQVKNLNIDDSKITSTTFVSLKINDGNEIGEPNINEFGVKNSELSSEQKLALEQLMNLELSKNRSTNNEGSGRLVKVDDISDPLLINEGSSDSNSSSQNERQYPLIDLNRWKIYDKEKDEEELEINIELRMFKCDMCESSFRDHRGLYGHKKYVHGDRIYQCDTCGKKFKKNTQLQRHLFTHQEERSWICEICEKGFKTERHLKSHKIIHDTSNDNAHVCEVCGKVFFHKNALKQHKDIHATDVVKNYACNLCAARFKQKNMLDRHMTLHTGEKKHECHICNKKFRLKSTLKSHLRIHDNSEHEKNYECIICNKKYRWESNLRAHMYWHKNEKKFKCNKCDKLFKDKNLLAIHLASHSDELNYECDICKKKFKTQFYLNRHKRFHFNKPFACDLCDAKFTAKHNLVNHKNRHNKNKNKIQTKKESDIESETETESECVSESEMEEKETDYEDEIAETKIKIEKKEDKLNENVSSHDKESFVDKEIKSENEEIESGMAIEENCTFNVS